MRRMNPDECQAAAELENDAGDQGSLFDMKIIYILLRDFELSTKFTHWIIVNEGESKNFDLQSISVCKGDQEFKSQRQIIFVGN